MTLKIQKITHLITFWAASCKDKLSGQMTSTKKTTDTKTKITPTIIELSRQLIGRALRPGPPAPLLTHPPHHRRTSGGPLKYLQSIFFLTNMIVPPSLPYLYTVCFWWFFYFFFFRFCKLHVCNHHFAFANIHIGYHPLLFAQMNKSLLEITNCKSVYFC